jgi:dienelactone hydrolase
MKTCLFYIFILCSFSGFSQMNRRGGKAAKVLTVKITGKNPIADEQMVFDVHLAFLPQEDGVAKKHPLVLVIPPITGYAKRERILAKKLNESGFNVAIVDIIGHPILSFLKKEAPGKDSLFYPSRKIENYQDPLIAAIDKIRMSINVLEQDKRVDTKNIHLWGSSYGGITGAMAAGVDKRIHKTVLVAAGSDIDDLVIKSQSNVMKALRFALMYTNNIERGDTAQFNDRIRNCKKFGAGQFWQGCNPSKYLMVKVVQDEFVPITNQNKLCLDINSFGNRVGEVEVLVEGELDHIGAVTAYSETGKADKLIEFLKADTNNPIFE